MSLDLYQDEANARLTELAPVQNVESGMFDGFARGTGMAAMRGLAAVPRAVDMLGSVGPIVHDAFTGGTEAQDKYFAEHDAVFGRAVDYWTPNSTEIGSAASVMGSLLSVLPQVIISPALAVATTQLGTAEDLMNAGVTSGKAQAVGAVQALTLGTGIWMPILGNNLWQRAVIGGAGFNVAQGTVARAASGAILEGTPAAEQFKAFDAEAMTLDTLMGLAFGGLAHVTPAMRKQGDEAWSRIQSWAENLNPSDKAAIATLREAQHLNTDSTPGKPVDAADIEAHVQRMRTAIDQLATDKPVNVEDVLATKTTENAEGEPVTESVQPTFAPDPERTAQAEATVRDLRAAGEQVRAEEGIAPPPTEPPRVVQSVRQTIEEQLARAGRPAEEATAGGALWDAFYTTMAKRLGTTAEELWNRFPLSKITNELPPGEALKQGPGGEPMLMVDQKLRPITNAEGRRIASDIQELKNFWNWFSDSKVTGQDGKPMVVYHGTTSDFSRFDGLEITGWFAEKPKRADVYTGGRMDGEEDSGPNIMPVYLAVKKPLDIVGRFDMNDTMTPAQLQRALPEVNLSARWAKEFTEQTNSVFDMINHNAFQEALVDSGFDGLRVTEKGDATWMITDPAQAKGAIGNRGTFDSKNPDILFQGDKRDTWYTSALGEAIKGLNMKAAPAKGWMDALKGLGSKGVKADEVKWSGIEEWLQIQEGRVTKEQVQEFLANNGVKVEEVMLGGKSEPNLGDPEIAADVRLLTERGFPPEQHPEDATMMAFSDEEGGDIVTAEEFRRWAQEDQPELRDVADAAARVERYWYGGNRTNEMTKFGTYQLPGGENYRELLLTLPPKATPKPDIKVEQIGTHDGEPVIRVSFGDVKADVHHNKGFPWRVDYPGGMSDGGFDTQEAAVAAAKKKVEGLAGWTTAEGGGGTFQSSHFDQANILAHVRFNERTDADGKRVLFIEEFQSDWAQKGKKEGFTDPAAMKAWTAELTRIRSDIDEAIMDAGKARPGSPEMIAAIERRTAAISEKNLHMSKRPGGTIAAAPFVGKTDAWVGLAMKRMIAYAAENGFDRVAWTRGEQQVERYTSALRKAVDVIEWTKTDKGVQLVGYKGYKAAPSGHSATDAINIMRQQATDALQRNDFLGFDSASDARQAIVDNTDWQQRWNVDQADAPVIQAWLDARQSALRGEPVQIPDNRQKVVDTTEKEDALSDAIGKAMADKIISDPNQSGTIEGDGIRIDSTGMAGFYDRIVPKVAGEVLKKLGGGKVADMPITGIRGLDFDRFDIRDDAGTGRWTLIDRATGEPVPEAPTFRTGSDAEKWVTENKDEASKQQGFDITPAMKAKVEGGLPLFQKTQGTERGYMSIGDEGRVIGLLQGADASTFVHESGHFFLDTLAAIGRDETAPPEVRADLDAALTWMGVKDPAKWGDMTLAQKRPFHEKFARGFEQYLRDGEAPSPELRGIFQRFRDWLVEVYKNAASLKVKLNDDIRGVLNRMLADQTRNPSTEAPPAPSERTGSPPPPRVGGEAQAGAEAQPDPVPGILERMALDETGWAQEGGKLLNVTELGTGKPSFTTWIPKAEWWTDRPDKKLNAAKVQEAVRKHLAGEKLKPAEQRTVDYMTQIAQDRARGIDRVGGEQEYQNTANDAWDEGLDPTTENVVDLDLVARAAAIDEAYVERAAMKYEHDDAAFRGELEMLIHENERAQATAAAGRSKAGEQAPPGGKPAAGEKAGQDIVRNEADLIAEQYHDMPIHVGTDEAGNAITMSAREFLEQARAEADMNRADIPLLEVAAQCMLGRS